MDHRFTAIYIVVWAVCAVGSAALLYGRGVPFRQKWFRRVALFNVLVIGGLLFVVASQGGDPRHNVLFLPIALAVVVLGVTRTRVCPACGAISSPQNLLSAPQFCRKCGAKLDVSDSGGPPVR